MATHSSVAVAAGVSILAICRVRQGFERYKDEGYRPVFQPRGPAFGVAWFGIYAATFTAPVVGLAGGIEELPWAAAGLAIAAWLGCAAWVLLFDVSSASKLGGAAAAIFVAAATSVAAAEVTLGEAEARGAGKDPKSAVSAVPLSLLGGWLLLASALQIDLLRVYVGKRGQREETVELGSFEGGLVVVGLAVLVGGMALFFLDAALPIPVFVGCFFQSPRTKMYGLIGMAVSALSVALSVAGRVGNWW